MNIFLPFQKILLLTSLFLFQLYALEPEHKQLLSPKATLLLLETIKKHAIVFGKGEKEVHVFIDPYCPFAKKYLSSLLKKSEERFKENTYYFYLYKLKQKNSTAYTIFLNKDLSSLNSSSLKKICNPSIKILLID